MVSTAALFIYGGVDVALIVEDGTGKVDAESYVSVEFFRDYHTKLGNTITAQDAAIEIALRKATAYMVATLRGSWKGRRSVINQALDHPRYDLWRDDYDLVPFNEVAKEAKVTCCELGLIALGGTSLMPTASKRGMKSIKIGPIAVTYDGDAATGTQFVAAMRGLEPLLTAAAGGGSVALIRC